MDIRLRTSVLHADWLGVRYLELRVRRSSDPRSLKGVQMSVIRDTDPCWSLLLKPHPTYVWLAVSRNGLSSGNVAHLKRHGWNVLEWWRSRRDKQDGARREAARRCKREAEHVAAASDADGMETDLEHRKGFMRLPTVPADPSQVITGDGGIRVRRNGDDR